MQAIGTCLLFLYLMSFKPQVKSTDENATDGQGDNLPAEKKEPQEAQFNFWKAISRLSFALYICNYLVIRTLFYTSRSPFPTTGFDMVSDWATAVA